MHKVKYSGRLRMRFCLKASSNMASDNAEMPFSTGNWSEKSTFPPKRTANGPNVPHSKRLLHKLRLFGQPMPHSNRFSSTPSPGAQTRKAGPQDRLLSGHAHYAISSPNCGDENEAVVISQDGLSKGLRVRDNLGVGSGRGDLLLLGGASENVRVHSARDVVPHAEHGARHSGKRHGGEVRQSQ